VKSRGDTGDSEGKTVAAEKLATFGQ